MPNPWLKENKCTADLNYFSSNMYICCITTHIAGLGLLYIWRHFQQYFIYKFINIVAVSFICGGNRSTRRNPPTCHKSLINTQCGIENSSPWMGFELTTLVVIGTDCTGSWNPNDHDGYLGDRHEYFNSKTRDILKMYVFALIKRNHCLYTSKCKIKWMSKLLFFITHTVNS